MPFSVKVNSTGSSIVLSNADDTCNAEIFWFGGLLNSFNIKTGSGWKNIIEGYKDVQDANENITNGFKSAKLSPFACRLNYGNYTLHGKKYSITKHCIPPHAIHGIVYDAVYDATDKHADEQSASVTLQYHYPGSDPGYPFPYDIQIKWELKAGNKLSATTTVKHSNDEEIPYVDGWHPYFTFGVPVDECSLQFDAKEMVEFDATLLPTGKTLPNDSFWKERLIGKDDLDNSFVLEKDMPDADCVMKGNGMKLTICPDKSYPFLQIYIPPQRDCIAIENLSGTPDAFNNGMGLIMLKKDTPVTFSTTYIIENI